jgi:cystathionine gamma-synthase
MSEQSSNWSWLTRLIHEGERPSEQHGQATVMPIHTAATYVYPSMQALDAAFATGEGDIYARFGSPSVRQLEQQLAMAEQGAGAVVFGSGMAALHAAILAAGTPSGALQPAVRGVVASQDVYGATTTLLDDFFAAQGIPVGYCDFTDLAALDVMLEQIKPNVVLLEQITNPLLKVVDVAAIAERAHAIGARLVVDNTIPSPILQRPLTLGADFAAHSATKYLGGHGDVTSGAVAASTEEQAQLLRRYLKLLGAVQSPFDAYLVARGIKTLKIRMQHQSANALALAQALQQHPQIARVHYPGLSSHPQHQLAQASFGGLYGAMVSFELNLPSDYSPEQTRERMFAFVDALQLILPAASLGDVSTLVSLPMISSHRGLSAEQRKQRGIYDTLVRLSVGLEEASDIIGDIEQALAKVQA